VKTERRRKKESRKVLKFFNFLLFCESLFAMATNLDVSLGNRASDVIISLSITRAMIE